MSMIVDAVRADDLDALMEIQTEAGLSPWSRDGYAEEMLRPDAVMLVTRSAEGIVTGFIVGRVPVDEPSESSSEAEILNIGVRSSFLRQGLGSMLMERFLKICEDRGASKVWLEVRAGNIAAIEFYSDYGFVAVSTRPNFYMNPVEDALLMVRE